MNADYLSSDERRDACGEHDDTRILGTFKLIARLRPWGAAFLIAAAAIAWPLAAARDDGLEKRLYVANDAGHGIDVDDVDRGHKLLRSITPQLNGRDLLDRRCRGIATHAATRRLYFTDSDQSNSRRAVARIVVDRAA